MTVKLVGRLNSSCTHSIHLKTHLQGRSTPNRVLTHLSFLLPLGSPNKFMRWPEIGRNRFHPSSSRLTTYIQCLIRHYTHSTGVMQAAFSCDLTSQSLTLPLWTRSRKAPPKHRYTSTTLHSIIVTAVRTSNPKTQRRFEPKFFWNKFTMPRCDKNRCYTAITWVLSECTCEAAGRK